MLWQRQFEYLVQRLDSRPSVSTRVGHITISRVQSNPMLPSKVSTRSHSIFRLIILISVQLPRTQTWWIENFIIIRIIHENVLNCAHLLDNRILRSSISHTILQILVYGWALDFKLGTGAVLLRSDSINHIALRLPRYAIPNVILTLLLKSSLKKVMHTPFISKVWGLKLGINLSNK